MRNIPGVIVLSLLLSNLLPVFPDAGLCQPFEIQRTNQPLYIDGNLDEPAWLAAPSFSPFVFTWYESGEKEQTEAKMLWDDRFLYVAFRCTDAHIAGIRTARNDSVYKDDTVELFISPNVKKTETYLNYEINCIGTYLAGKHPDLQSREYIEPTGLMIGRSHKGTINNDADNDAWWIIEMAVPFEHFRWTGLPVPPPPGTAMRLNLHRLGGVVNQQWSQWKQGDPNKRGFHTPQYFGEVILSPKVSSR